MDFDKTLPTIYFLLQAHLAVIHGISEQLVIQRKGRKVFLENYTFINEVISWRSFDRISIENPLKWNPTFIGTLKFTDLEPWFKFLIFIRQITNQKCEKGNFDVCNAPISTFESFVKLNKYQTAPEFNSSSKKCSIATKEGDYQCQSRLGMSIFTICWSI